MLGQSGRSGFTLVELMIVMAVIAVIAALAIPGLIAAQRSSNERNASASLKTLGTAEYDFRANDRDGNEVADFWTGDVVGLCIIRPFDSSGAPAADGPNAGIKLIESSVAAADGDATAGLALYTTAQAPANRPFSVFQPKAGFIFRAAVADATAAPPLRNDTDPTASYLACHNVDRFAFLAAPFSLGTGRLAFILNHETTMYKVNLNSTYLSGYAGGVGSVMDITGSGSATLDMETYPANPSAVGFSKLD